MITNIKFKALNNGVYKISWDDDGTHLDYYFHSIAHVVKSANSKKTPIEFKRVLKEWLEA